MLFCQIISQNAILLSSNLKGAIGLCQGKQSRKPVTSEFKIYNKFSRQAKVRHASKTPLQGNLDKMIEALIALL